MFIYSRSLLMLRDSAWRAYDEAAFADHVEARCDLDQSSVGVGLSCLPRRTRVTGRERTDAGGRPGGQDEAGAGDVDVCERERERKREGGGVSKRGQRERET